MYTYVLESLNLKELLHSILADIKKFEDDLLMNYCFMYIIIGE